MLSPTLQVQNPIKQDSSESPDPTDYDYQQGEEGITNIFIDSQFENVPAYDDFEFEYAWKNWMFYDFLFDISRHLSKTQY